MTSPKGKILLAKLPKDIIQFCIEPMLMVSETEVRENHRQVMCRLHDFNPDNYFARRYALPIKDDSTWSIICWISLRQILFTEEREERKRCDKLRKLRELRKWMDGWIERIPCCRPFVVWRYNAAVTDYNATVEKMMRYRRRNNYL